jgi:hypothetical protein
MVRFDFPRLDYEECRLLGLGAVWLFWELMFGRIPNVRPQSSEYKTEEKKKENTKNFVFGLQAYNWTIELKNMKQCTSLNANTFSRLERKICPLQQQIVSWYNRNSPWNQEKCLCSAIQRRVVHLKVIEIFGGICLYLRNVIDSWRTI